VAARWFVPTQLTYYLVGTIEEKAAAVPATSISQLNICYICSMPKIESF
jgi:hypothetical protein